MSPKAVSRELALRIALAARALPNTDSKLLLAVLTDCVDAPMTESKIATIALETFSQGNGGALAHVSSDILLQALKILSNTAADKILPTIQAYQNGDLPNSVRIACASDDAIHVNGHFGNCAWFMIYQVNVATARLIDIRTADIPEGLVVYDKNVHRAEQLQDCKVVYVASVGGPAAAKIVRFGIHPIRLENMASLADIISQLQTVMAGTPPPLGWQKQWGLNQVNASNLPGEQRADEVS